MAIYHFQAKVIQRSAGRSVVAAAAYRAAAALYDAELGRTQNFLAKTGVVHSEILLPDGAPSRWLDRETLWNEVTAGERRHDAVLAREIEIALPRELSQAEAIALVQDFVREQFVARGMVADLNVHWSTAADGTSQPHAHVLLTMRAVVPGEGGHPEDGRFGLKQRGWNDKALLRSWRERWAELANQLLAEAGHDRRIDHRSHAARGIDLEPQNKIGPAGARRAVRGEDAERADEHRALARRNGERLLADPVLALQALTQQQSTFTRADLARLVHRHSDGAEQFAAVLAKVETSPELVRVGEDGRDRERFSTREILAIERRMEATALALSGRTTHAVDAARRRTMLAGTSLGTEQQLAFGHVTRSRDLAVVVGYAGTGKSTMLGVARLAWEAEGYAVRGTALSGIAAEGLEAGSGIASRTIAGWEHAWSQGFERLGSRDVLVMDEAGMVGSRQMERVLAAVRDAGAKLVLVGDHEQLQAIEAGAAFRAIAERVGAVEITEVRRQLVDWQREATRELATGRTAAALGRYAAAGKVQEHATDAAARAALVAGWQAARQKAPDESQIILTHTRADAQRLNGEARGLRRAAGELGPDHALLTELGERHFAVGDWIYFLRNERGLGVKNGTLGAITDIAGEGAAARISVRLDRKGRDAEAASVSFGLSEYAHIDHGYAATMHKAQSVTVDRVHVLATPGMDRHLAYVGMSRHRQSLALHWSREAFGSQDGLMARLGRERAKDTTLDYAETEAELCAVYAERRGLNPLAPTSEILVPASPANLAPDRSVPADPPVLVAGQPGLAWRNLRRVRIAAALRPVLPALQRALESQAAIAARLAAVMQRLENRIAERPSLPAPIVPGRVMQTILARLADLRPREEEPLGDQFTFEPNGARLKALSASEGNASPRASASAPQTQPARSWPWENAPAAVTPPVALLPATPYRPVTQEDVAAVVDADVKVRAARRDLADDLGTAYRDPAKAAEQLAALERQPGGAGAVVAQLSRRSTLLGKLCGSDGYFASTKDVVSRTLAVFAVGRIGSRLVAQREAEANADLAYRGPEITHRRSEAVEVPGLSHKAQLAIEAISAVGAPPGWNSASAWNFSPPTPDEIALAARMAPVWSAIEATPDLHGELRRFTEAARQRFALTCPEPPATSGDPVSTARRFSSILRGAETLHYCHPGFQAYAAAEPQRRARATREAEQRRLEAERVTEQTHKLEAEQAETERKFREGRKRHTPRPSSGPSMG